MPFRKTSPTTASPIPPHAAAGTAVLNRPSARSGANTTYSPVIRPVLETVVRWRPAVCRPYAAAEQEPAAHAGQPAGARQRLQRPPGERREHCGRDREPHGEEREHRVDRDGLLDGHEGVAPDRRHGDEQEQRSGGPSRPREPTGEALRCTRDGHRTPGTAAARPADLGHRPLQLPLRLLHAEGGLRQRLPLHGPQGAAQLRGDRARRGDVRRRSASRSCASRAASRSCAATSSA